MIMDNNEEKNNHRTIKTIIMIIIIIIIILLLITSCTSGFWGRIGGLFNREIDTVIDSNSGKNKVIVNRDLHFNSNYVDFNVSDENAKITFSFDNINPDKFTCSTSNADIAVCYVKDDYVVIEPKGTGIRKI